MINGKVPDTGEIPVVLVPCKYLSREFIETMDRDYGKQLKENGGYVTYTIRMEGRAEPRWWEKVVRILSGRGPRD